MPITDTCTVDTYFTPKEGSASISRVVEIFAAAQKTIDGIDFCLDNSQVCAALEAAGTRGVAIGGTGIVVDVSQLRGAAALAAMHGMILRGINADAFTAGNVAGHFEHYKVFVVDGRWVIGGSENFTKDGPLEGNAMHVFDSPVMATAFLQVIASEKARIRSVEPAYQKLIA